MNDSLVQRSPHVLWRVTLDTVILLPPALDEPIALAGTGPEIWELLAEQRRVGDLVDTLAQRHGADTAVVREDVEALLRRLTKVGAVVKR
jgi:hypothetical protein